MWTTMTCRQVLNSVGLKMPVEASVRFRFAILLEYTLSKCVHRNTGRLVCAISFIMRSQMKFLAAKRQARSVTDFAHIIVIYLLENSILLEFDPKKKTYAGTNSSNAIPNIWISISILYQIFHHFGQYFRSRQTNGQLQLISP